MTMYRVVNGVRIELTPTEESERLAEEAQGAIDDHTRLESIVRKKRDTLLLETDWTQTDDAPLTDASKYLWMVYRQGLRDIPEQGGFPDDVTWPTAPEVSSDSDLETQANSDAIEAMTEDEAIAKICTLTETLEDGTVKTILSELLTIFESKNDG